MPATRARILGVVVAAGTVFILLFTNRESDIVPQVAVEDTEPAAPGVAQSDGPVSPGVARRPVSEATPYPGNQGNLAVQQAPVASIPAAPARQPAAALPVPAVDVAALEADLGQVELLIRQYREVLGENPVGTNAEIMKAVLGDNLKQAKFSMPEGQRLNEKGELVDRWGHAYFFHQVSRTRMEIRSAGADGVMWTGDDMQM